MMQTHMTHWIEDADARQACAAAVWNQIPTLPASHYHFGEMMGQLPMWIISGAARQYLIGARRAVTHARHSFRSLQH